MFRIEVSGMQLEKELQIVQADVRVEVDGETVVDEALCVDVGLPALLYSCFEPTLPDRWAAVEDWRSMPFFVCGCGDPECRGIGFRTRLLETEDQGEQVEWVLVEQAEDRSYREQETYRIELAAYRQMALEVAERFLATIEDSDYRPLMADTEAVVREYAEKLRQALRGSQ